MGKTGGGVLRWGCRRRPSVAAAGDRCAGAYALPGTTRHGPMRWRWRRTRTACLCTIEVVEWQGKTLVRIRFRNAATKRQGAAAGIEGEAALVRSWQGGGSAGQGLDVNARDGMGIRAWAMAITERMP